MSLEKEEASTPRRRLSCTTHFNALWFCYSPVHQMQQYYRLGDLDNCSGKWTALVDCLSLKTKRSSEVEVCLELAGRTLLHCWILDTLIIFQRIKLQLSSIDSDIGAIGNLYYRQEIMESREKARPHIWSFRSPEDAASHWKELFGKLDEQE